MNQAILFDKMRVESGQSTQNISLAQRVEYLDKHGLFDQSTGDLRQEIKQASPFALKQEIHNPLGAPEVVENIEDTECNVG